MQHAIVDALFFRTWWSYARDGGSWYSELYHWFNLFEAGAWFVFAGLVFRRHARHRRSPLELWYAAAFFAFGLTDVREAWLQQSWLIWIKAINLAALLVLRRAVMRRFHPGAKVY